VADARKIIADDLQAKGLIEKTDQTYKHNVAVCYKCKNVIEPRVMPQWFIKIKPLAEPAILAVQEKRIRIIPDRHEKVFMHWMKNIRDWNISRQIWWGIPIPAYFCSDCGEFTVDIEKKPSRCEKCKSKNMVQDPDTFDTWFSSGQWPFALLKANSEEDFKTFYPTSVMETGWDILFFWVARMIMLGIYATGEIPFKTVYLHGLIRDKDRQKMSKSKGNVIDPLAVIDQYGADALRMALIVGNLPGNDIVISEEKIKGYRNFSNKVWNAARFVIQNTHDFDALKADLTVKEEAELKQLDVLIEKVTEMIEKFDFAHAAETLYHFFWHTFADKIIEESKLGLDTPENRSATQAMLLIMLKTQLKLLHPFMPFVTESIWQIMDKNFLMAQEWPQTRKMYKKKLKKQSKPE
jgi:valyl-tRNA synthetase